MRPARRIALARALACAMAVAASLAGCALSPQDREEIAPGQTLRVAIGLSAPLAARVDASGRPEGLTPDLAREAARRLDATAALVTFDSPADVQRALRDGSVDLAFVPLPAAQQAQAESSAPLVIALLPPPLATPLADGTQHGPPGPVPTPVVAAAPRGRLAAQRWFTQFVEQVKASGYVQGALLRHGVAGAVVAPSLPTPGR